MGRRGRTVRAFALGARAGAHWQQWPAVQLSNKSLERTVIHRGRTVRAFALGARAGAHWQQWPAVQRNR